MNGECAIEQNGSRQAVPNLDRDLHAGFRRAKRDQTQRVIDQMRRDIGKKNEAGGHPQIPAYRAGEPLREQSALLATMHRAQSREDFRCVNPNTEYSGEPRK